MSRYVFTTAEGLDTWREVITLLVAASDRGRDESFTDPVIMSSAWGAGIAAAAAIELLPNAQAYRLDQVELDPAAAGMSAAELIGAAESATRRHPIEEFPVGASRVIVAICDLAAGLPR